MARRLTGRYERSTLAGVDVNAFIPHPLPPAAPPMVLNANTLQRVRDAEQALVRLELAGEMVPSLEWFIYGFVRKEAVLSSQIEGTQATLIDLLTFEAQTLVADTVKDADVEEVCNYLEALNYAREQIASPSGLPISMRLLNESHARLMRGARGADKLPGEVRRSQNWIGGSQPADAIYVPPPPQALAGLLSALEKYIHSSDILPPLVRAGLLHVQFETIHPYLDGNGRIGRLFVTLLLEHWQLLTRPMLYLSLYFKRHRDAYYRRLNAVRTEGAWEAWIDFFLHGVMTIADEAATTARDIFALVSQDRQHVLAHKDVTVPALRVFDLLAQKPIISVSHVMQQLATSKPTAGRAIDTLVKAGVLVETTGKKRYRTWAYHTYIERLRAGTDLEPP